MLFTASAGMAYADTLPLGDGKISAEPKQDHVFACQSSFGRGGPAANGPWIVGADWKPDAKPVIQGNVIWPTAMFDMRLEQNTRIIASNGFPGHATGEFPVSTIEPAYAYDPNPNTIAEQGILWRLPLNPQEAQDPSCLPMGAIGIMLTGAPLFSALDAKGHDAPAHEALDHCGGHPAPRGEYHYHAWSECFTDEAGRHGMHSDLVGYALDGFGIYGPMGEDGERLSNANLDACHGHTHAILWDGKMKTMYHYHFTAEYPYSLGCFAGTPAHLQLSAPQQKQPVRWRVVPIGPRGVTLPPATVER